jgi:hypothetical protein
MFGTPQMVAAQTTKFSYQGQLTDSGTPQATYQMRFRLFDALSSGSEVGSTIENASVAVSDGIFTVSLDFGAPVFSGADRFLEIAVRRNGGEGYTVLSPRQQIASSPYSTRRFGHGHQSRFSRRYLRGDADLQRQCSTCGDPNDRRSQHLGKVLYAFAKQELVYRHITEFQRGSVLSCGRNWRANTDGGSARRRRDHVSARKCRHRHV